MRVKAKFEIVKSEKNWVSDESSIPVAVLMRNYYTKTVHVKTML